MDDEYDFMMVDVKDVFIVSLSLEYEFKVKRSVEDEKLLLVDFIVFVYLDEKNKFFGVFQDIVLCGINNMCIVNGFILDEMFVDFNYKLCKLMVNKVDYLGILFCVVKEFKDVFFKNQKYLMSMCLYYVIGGIGGFLLIVIIIGLLLC